MDIVDRLQFDALRCEMQFSKGVASNITEAAAEIRRLRLALMAISQRMNYGTMTSEMRYAKAWADDALNEQIVMDK